MRSMLRRLRRERRGESSAVSAGLLERCGSPSIQADVEAGSAECRLTATSAAPWVGLPEAAVDRMQRSTSELDDDEEAASSESPSRAPKRVSYAGSTHSCDSSVPPTRPRSQSAPSETRELVPLPFVPPRAFDHHKSLLIATGTFAATAAGIIGVVMPVATSRAGEERLYCHLGRLVGAAVYIQGLILWLPLFLHMGYVMIAADKVLKTRMYYRLMRHGVLLDFRDHDRPVTHSALFWAAALYAVVLILAVWIALPELNQFLPTVVSLVVLFYHLINAIVEQREMENQLIPLNHFMDVTPETLMRPNGLATSIQHAARCLCCRGPLEEEPSEQAARTSDHHQRWVRCEHCDAPERLVPKKPDSPFAWPNPPCCIDHGFGWSSLEHKAAHKEHAATVLKNFELLDEDEVQLYIHWLLWVDHKPFEYKRVCMRDWSVPIKSSLNRLGVELSPAWDDTRLWREYVELFAKTGCEAALASINPCRKNVAISDVPWVKEARSEASTDDFCEFSQLTVDEQRMRWSGLADAVEKSPALIRYIMWRWIFWSQLWALEVFLLVRFARGRLVHVFLTPAALDLQPPIDTSGSEKTRLERLVAKATKVHPSRVHLHELPRHDGALDFTIYARDYPVVALMWQGRERHGLSKRPWQQWRREEAEAVRQNLHSSDEIPSGSAECVEDDDEEVNFQEEKDRIFQSWFVLNYLVCQFSFALLILYGIYLYDPSDISPSEWAKFDCDGAGWGSFHWL